MEGTEQRTQLHYEVFAAELGWLRAQLGLALRAPQTSLRAARGRAGWRGASAGRCSRSGFVSGTLAALAVRSLLSWFCLFALVSVSSNRVVAVQLTSPVCQV